MVTDLAGFERDADWWHGRVDGDPELQAKIDEAAATLKAEGYHLVALETAQGAACYLEYHYPEKVCLVLGNETKGVYSQTLSLCDGAVYIPMYGKGPSMNVHVAGALVAYRALMVRDAKPQE